MTLKAWLQLFRSQTAPATILLLLTPYLENASFFHFKTLILAIALLLIHYVSFGHNSLMDTAMMYDQRDPSKKHHPLIQGTIKLSTAHTVIHWSFAFATVACAILTVFWGAHVGYAMICLMAWVSFGHAYNDGLSKESLLGFIAISICFTAMGGWGWFLSSRDLNPVGWLYIGYAFCTILYQISWSGFIKDMALKERSNILTKMGVWLDVKWDGTKIFRPNKARFYAYMVKGTGLLFAWLLCWLNYNPVRLIWCLILSPVILTFLHISTTTRVYNRSKELMSMSLMEIVTIYLPIPLLLDPVEATILMVSGILYFFLINLVLWGKPYPRV